MENAPALTSTEQSQAKMAAADILQIEKEDSQGDVLKATCLSYMCMVFANFVFWFLQIWGLIFFEGASEGPGSVEGG